MRCVIGLLYKEPSIKVIGQEIRGMKIRKDGKIYHEPSGKRTNLNYKPTATGWSLPNDVK